MCSTVSLTFVRLETALPREEQGVKTEVGGVRETVRPEATSVLLTPSIIAQQKGWLTVLNVTRVVRYQHPPITALTAKTVALTLSAGSSERTCINKRSRH